MDSNQKFVFVVLATLTLSTGVLAKRKGRPALPGPKGVDYSKCAEYFNSRHSTAPAFLSDFDAGAFFLDGDGSIYIGGDASYSSRKEKDKRTTQIDVSRSVDRTGFFGGKQKAKMTSRTLIIQDSKNNIREVRRFTQRPSDAALFPSRSREETKKVVRFEIRNGQCVPVQLTYGRGVHLGGVEGTDHELGTVYNIDLCKGIHDLMAKHPKISSCSKALNDKMLDVLNKHVFTSRDEPHQSWDNPHQRDNGGDTVGAMVRKAISYKRGGGLLNSALMIGNAIFGRCQDHGLKPFLQDSSIWEKSTAASKGGKGGSVLSK